MAIIYKTTVKCSCGCGKDVEHEFKAWASGACRVRESRSKTEDIVGSADVVTLSKPKKVKGAIAVTGDAVDFIKSRGYTGVCKHGSAIGLCKHGCSE